MAGQIEERKPKPTPTPWDYIEGRTLIHVETRHDNPKCAGLSVCSIPTSREADAAFIVEACNAHATLVAALREIEAG